MVHLRIYTPLEVWRTIWTKPSWLQVLAVNLRGASMLNFRGVSPNKQLKSWSLELFQTRCPDLDFCRFFNPNPEAEKTHSLHPQNILRTNAFRFCRIDIDFSWFLHGIGWRSTTFSRNDLISVLGIWSFWKDHIRCVDFQEYDVMFNVCVRV